MFPVISSISVPRSRRKVCTSRSCSPRNPDRGNRSGGQPGHRNGQDQRALCAGSRCRPANRRSRTPGVRHRCRRARTAPTFSINGTNAAKNATATFSNAGAYTLKCTITFPGGFSVTSSVNVTVNATLTTISVSPTPVTVGVGLTQHFAAVGLDQFGALLSSQPTFTWSLASGSIGSIDGMGLYTAPSAPGSATVRATSGLVTGTATVTIVAPPIVLGDFNQDGHVDTSDMMPAMQALTNPTGYETQYGVSAANLQVIGDVNGDGRVDNRDIQALICLVANQSVTDPSAQGAGTVSLALSPTTNLVDASLQPQHAVAKNQMIFAQPQVLVQPAALPMLPESIVSTSRTQAPVAQRSVRILAPTALPSHMLLIDSFHADMESSDIATVSPSKRAINLWESSARPPVGTTRIDALDSPFENHHWHTNRHPLKPEPTDFEANLSVDRAS